VPPEMENRKFFACFISGDTFTINTLLINKHIKDSQIQAKCFDKISVYNTTYFKQ
jgi:hypothetical protein